MNLNDKINLVEDLLRKGNFRGINSIISAYISCLSAEEACKVICSFYPIHDVIYHYLLIKISKDIQKYGIPRLPSNNV